MLSDEELEKLSAPILFGDPEFKQFMELAVSLMPTPQTKWPISVHGEAIVQGEYIEDKLLTNLRLHFLSLEGQIAERDYVKDYLQKRIFHNLKGASKHLCDASKLLDKWIGLGYLEAEDMLIYGAFQTVLRPVGLMEAYTSASNFYILHGKINNEKSGNAKR
ncbi:MAG: hypothetical protein Kapaf2KO_23750 [Candidatus Kapaibacteriales bacterium]